MSIPICHLINSEMTVFDQHKLTVVWLGYFFTYNNYGNRIYYMYYTQMYIVSCCFVYPVCNCDAEGTARDICDPNNGTCICMKNFAGPRCDICNEGYYRFPVCRGK